MSAVLLILLGTIIAIGFLGDLFFEKTRVPHVLLLMAAGLLIGPVFRLVQPESVRPFMAPFGAIALTIILFEGGLDLNLRSAIGQAGRALLLACLSFLVSIFLLYYALALGFGVSGTYAWAVAAALACTSAPIVIPVAGKLLPNSPMKALLAVESAVSDALAVMTVIALLGLEDRGGGSSILLGKLGMSFLMGAGSAMVAGAIWLLLLSRLYARRFFYLMTIGFVFLLMGLVEALHGSGALAVLVFGLVLANGEVIVGLFGARVKERATRLFAEGQVALHPGITNSNAEISFMIRSFFFVYLGIIFKWPGSDARLWLTIIIASVAIVVGRIIAVQLTAWTTRIALADKAMLNAMVPRGLATAVLASMMATQPQSDAIPADTLAVFIVVISNLVMTLSLAKRNRAEGNAHKEASQ